MAELVTVVQWILPCAMAAASIGIWCADVDAFVNDDLSNFAAGREQAAGPIRHVPGWLAPAGSVSLGLRSRGSSLPDLQPDIVAAAESTRR